MGCPVGGLGLHGASSAHFSSRSFLLSMRRGRVLGPGGEDAGTEVGVASFSLLTFRGKVAEDTETTDDEDGVVGESTEMVCHFSANSLKFLELGDFAPALSFFCVIARSLGRFGPSESPFLVSWEILSSINLLPDSRVPDLPYFFPNSVHLSCSCSLRSWLISSEIAESLLSIELFLLKGAFSETMLLFLLDRLE